MTHTTKLQPFTETVHGVNVPRCADQLIIYTASYGTSTATNEYGYEIVVEDGLVVSLGGNDLTIPTNGFVLSFHGCAMQRVRGRIAKGMTVQYDAVSQTVTFDYTSQGLQRVAERAVRNARECIDRAAAAFVFADYDKALSTWDALYRERLALEHNRTASVEQYGALIEKADALCQALCDSYPVQYRGVWIRPSQASADEVDAYVRTLHDARINFVCVEGWFANGVIMEVPQGSLFGRHPRFDYDVLQAYIDACHRYGMECHLWMPIMNIGDQHGDGYETNTVPGKMPQWLSLNNHGSPYNASGFMMIDPANREARAYLMDFYRYIVTRYDIDCFEMDYIRYFAASEEADYGYTEAAFKGFEDAYGYGVTPQYDPSAPYWEDWCRYRRDCVTAWAKELRAMIDREAPHVRLAADVAFPFGHATHTVYQDFPRWLEEGLLDILHPMAYGDGYGDDIRKAVLLASDRCMVVTGLGAQGDLLRTEELERQARENPLYGAYGECYFEAAAYFYKHLPPILKETVYRNTAIPPFADVAESVSTMLAYMINRIDTVIYPRGGMTEAEVTAVKSAVEKITSHMNDETLPMAEFSALYRTVTAVGNTNAMQVLEKDIYRAIHPLCVKHRLHAESFIDDTER